jgi:hypothetical protein
MKKGKFLSVLTSLAMAGTMVLSAVPFTASAAGDASTVGLKLTSAKTTFTMDEVASGSAKTTVYVNASTDFDASAEVVSITAALESSDWDTVAPVNFIYQEPNQLGTSKKGSKLMKCFNTNATMIGSVWTETVPTVGGVTIGDFTSVGYSDTTKPKFILMSDSGTGFIQTNAKNAGENIAEFDIEIPANAKAGEYTINFCDTEVSIGSFAGGGSQTTYTDIPTTGITIKIGDTAETTKPAETTVSQVSLEYVGDCKLWAETLVPAAAGETVEVPVYIDTNGEVIEGLGAMITYDKSALTLEDVMDPELSDNYCDGGLGLTNMGLSGNADKGTLLIQLTDVSGMA